MRPFSVSPKFPQLVELPSQTNVATNTAVGPSDPGKSGIELQGLSKAAAAIRTGIKADTSAKPSFSLPNSPTKPQMHAVPNMQRINDDNNKTKRSSLGKTSGVF
ncbi:MAG: hypothetical protein H7327_01620, partial [Herminiimonas sp.]|nr:hypothetical protein [Herminiimonas sp.]